MILYFINLCILCTFPTSTLQKQPSCVSRNATGNAEYVCCAEEYLDKTTCLECPNGTTSKKGSTNKSDCVNCQSPFYGYQCIEQCKCNALERCDHAHGCISITTEAGTTITSKTTPNYTNNYVDQAEWMMILSSSVVVLCLVIVMTVFLSKCYSRMRPNEAHTIKQMSKKDKEKPQERKKNVYGTYEKKSITTDDDEFEFDTDNDDEDEDAYAMIRESQIFTTDVNTD